MTKSSFADQTFDCVSAIEVLEHIENDSDFINQVYRVLKKGGVFFMTTPNGDFVENTNPDHKRHYHRNELIEKLSSFDEIEVFYAVKRNYFHRIGLKSWSIKYPIKTILSMAGNVINAHQSGEEFIRDQSLGTNHLVAIARKV